MANAQDRVVPILEQFNKTPDAATANRFFDELQKAEFTDEKITFANNTPIDSLRQQVWYWAAEWLYDQQQYEQAEQYALKALPKYHPANPEKADCLNTLGCIYIRLSDFKQAANYAKQSVKIEMKGGDHDRIASSMNTLAGIYMAGYQAKEAEQIILQAIDHINQVDNPGRKAIILGMASEIYHTLGNDSKALPYAEQAIDIEQQLGRKPKLAIRLSQKGSALLGLHRYKEAEDIYRLILPEFKEIYSIKEKSRLSKSAMMVSRSTPRALRIKAEASPVRSFPWVQWKRMAPSCTFTISWRKTPNCRWQSSLRTIFG
jgi:tetratricopeptide (TPR) repeat protein